MNDNLPDQPIFSYQQPEESTGYLLWQVTMGWHLRMNSTCGQSASRSRNSRCWPACTGCAGRAKP